MSTQQAAKVETTGIKDADAFITEARKLGLDVEIKLTNSEAVYYRDGVTVMLPEVLSVMVMVSMPVPAELNDTALGLAERSTILTSCWSKRKEPRARGRWVLANYSTLGGHEDLHVKRRVYTRLEIMADNLKRLRKLVEG